MDAPLENRGAVHEPDRVLAGRAVRHRMSDCRLVEVPDSAMLQLGSDTVANIAALAIAAPFMSQITFSPVARLRHRISTCRLH